MKYWPRMMALADKYAAIPAVAVRQSAIMAAKTAIEQHHLPQAQLPKLALPLSSFAEAAMVPNGKLDELMALSHLFGNFRWYLAYHYGIWAYVTEELIETWVDLFPGYRYLELAAGNGLISYGLRQAGQSVIATDSLTWVDENGTGKAPWTAVNQASATAALWQYGDQVDAVILAWSPDKDPVDQHILQLIRSQFPHLTLFCIGDRFGITNSETFWRTAHRVTDRRVLKLNQAFRQFDAVGDRIYIMD